MARNRPLRLGIALGVLMIVAHAIWAMCVSLGWAQLFMDFIFRLHFIDPPYRILPFDMVTALKLLGFTGLVGLISGYLIGLVLDATRSKD